MFNTYRVTFYRQIPIECDDGRCVNKLIRNNLRTSVAKIANVRILNTSVRVYSVILTKTIDEYPGRGWNARRVIVYILYRVKKKKKKYLTWPDKNTFIIWVAAKISQYKIIKLAIAVPIWSSCRGRIYELTKNQSTSGLFNDYNVPSRCRLVRVLFPSLENTHKRQIGILLPKYYSCEIRSRKKHILLFLFRRVLRRMRKENRKRIDFFSFIIYN